MKRNLHTTHLVAFAVALTAVLITQPVFAQAPTNVIVITENSSTSLTATYNGSTSGITVTPNGPDSWTLDFPASVSLFSPPFDWIEPENPSLANAVSFPSHTRITVLSDVGTNSNFLPVMDEGTQFGVGTDNSNGGAINLTFDDDAATAEVPDTGSTLGLFALALAALFGASRFRALRLA